MKEKLQSITPKNFMWKNRLKRVCYSITDQSIVVIKSRQLAFSEAEVKNIVSEMEKTFAPIGFKVIDVDVSRCKGYYRSFGWKGYVLTSENIWVESDEVPELDIFSNKLTDTLEILLHLEENPTINE